MDSVRQATSISALRFFDSGPHHSDLRCLRAHQKPELPARLRDFESETSSSPTFIYSCRCSRQHHITYTGDDIGRPEVPPFTFEMRCPFRETTFCIRGRGRATSPQPRPSLSAMPLIIKQCTISHWPQMLTASGLIMVGTPGQGSHGQYARILRA